MQLDIRSIGRVTISAGVRTGKLTSYITELYEHI